MSLNQENTLKRTKLLRYEWKIPIKINVEHWKYSCYFDDKIGLSTDERYYVDIN